jgi:hypothetical protein
LFRSRASLEAEIGVASKRRGLVGFDRQLPVLEFLAGDALFAALCESDFVKKSIGSGGIRDHCSPSADGTVLKTTGPITFKNGLELTSPLDGWKHAHTWRNRLQLFHEASYRPPDS